MTGSLSTPRRVSGNMRRMDQVRTLRPLWRNVVMGLVDMGAPALLLAAVLGNLSADAGSSNAVVAFAAIGPLFAGGVVVWKRYAPMFVRLDKARDEITYRNVWTAGQLRWADVEYFEPKEVFVGYRVARAVMADGRKVTLRAAPYERFLSRLRALHPMSEPPADAS